jgi:hypothetical protein
MHTIHYNTTTGAATSIPLLYPRPLYYNTIPLSSLLPSPDQLTVVQHVDEGHDVCSKVYAVLSLRLADIVSQR